MLNIATITLNTLTKIFQSIRSNVFKILVKFIYDLYHFD